MREKRYLKTDWQFHLNELETPPKKLSKKAHAFGGFTSALTSEDGAMLPISAGGSHFLNLISQGNLEIGLRNLCGTILDVQLDESWERVTLPHDWKVKLPYINKPELLMAGSKEDGVGYYRKRFSIEKAQLGKRIYLHFDGVARMADVWLNGAYIGHNESGYTSFSFDISEIAYYGDEGENTLLVRAETTSGSEGWWYEGSGLYKPVYLKILPQVHLIEEDIYIYTKSLTDEKAILGIEVGVANDSDIENIVTPKIQIGGVSIELPALVLESQGLNKWSTEIEIKNPKPWSPENPYLYQAQISINGDSLEKEFGIRTFAYDEKGFYLNGQSYELHGVCEHQDFAGVGIALTKDIVDYKVKRMKEMGGNAYRSAHHFASKDLLEACDHFGILVMNENRIPEASPWRLEDFKHMIKLARNHASLAFWSIGNEELIGNTKYGARIMNRFAKLVKNLDYEHLTVSAELLNPEGIVENEYVTHFDILGINYPEAEVMGAGAEMIKQNNPHLPMMSTENASYFSSRGIYHDDEKRCLCNNFGSMYSMVLPGKRKEGEPGVGGTARPEEVMNYLNNHSYMGGVFLWTFFDYFGEPAPFAYPAISSQFGICDLNGFPKDYFYYYQAHWINQPVLHIMPHWNKEGLELDENGETIVRVFSNAEEVELYLNDVSQGRQTIQDCIAEWSIPYQEGTVLAKAYQENQEILSVQKETSKKTVSIHSEIVHVGEELDLISISAVDESGHLVPTAEHLVEIEVEGARIVGLNNGNPSDVSAYSLSETRLFSGKALVILEKTDQEYHISCSLSSVK